MPLVALKPFKTPFKAAAAQVSQLFNNPPPTGGLNLRDPISNMAPQDALVLENFIPRQQGVELRKGNQVHTTALGGVTKFESIFAYNAADSADNKMFAAFNGAIYDVTSEPAAITSASATGSTNDQWWTTHFATTSGIYLLAVSPGAGYWTYDPIGGWVDRTSACTNLTTAARTVAVWKQRVWFTLDGSSDVYYLANVNSIQDTATVMPMGSVLRNGGSISSLINWTIDAGFGVDDYLVAVGTEGDIGVWQGTDPTDASKFGLKGIWYIGPVPKYGVYFTPFGGDVMILSQQGLIPMSKVVSGQYNEAASNLMPASKVQAELVKAIRTLKNVEAWNVIMVPQESILIIQLPVGTYNLYTQFVMNTITGAWCTFSNMDMVCTTLLDGQLYYADATGKVIKGLFGNVADADINGANGTTIQGELQGAFNSYNTPAQLKRFGLVRPVFISTGPPAVKVSMNTQYNVTSVTGVPYFSDPEGALWDTGLWNESYFAASSNTYQAWAGINNLGYYGSLRMKVKGLPGTLLTSAHVLYELGGVM